jgi:hypothetical protein
MFAVACASGEATNALGNLAPNGLGGSGGGSGGGGGGTEDGAALDGSNASSGSSSGATGDDGGGSSGTSSSGASGDDASDGSATDDAASSGSSGASGGSSGPSSSGGSGSSSSGSGGSSGGTTYACVTTLSPAPVCDSKHQYCLCTKDSQCNSGGTNIGNPGGCNQSNRCSPQSNCTGGQFKDSAGCSVVAPFCNLGGNNACPTNTACEVNHGDCGGSIQCCWCTSDTGCPVSGKCVNDPTQNQCSGKGPCTGTGTNFDGMHCELASPGIPMCTSQ